MPEENKSSRKNFFRPTEGGGKFGLTYSKNETYQSLLSRSSKKVIPKLKAKNIMGYFSN